MRGCAYTGSLRIEKSSDLTLLLLALSQPHARATAILVNELHAGGF
jgi:hypothetical protein